MKNFEQFSIVWSDYIKYKIGLRGFEFSKIEDILRYSAERYFDTVTKRMIVIGKHDSRLVMLPYEKKENKIIPITIHATTRQQVNFRLKTGRFIYE
ncbi:MAG: hypothetical protein AB1498_06845 [bacterium]